MAYPTRDNNHVAEATGYLIEQFKKAPLLTGWVKTLASLAQDVESMLWDVINLRMFNSSTAGDQLTKIGKIVGEPRAGRLDAELYPAILLRIRVNRSQGLAEDIIQIASLIFGAGATTYTEQFPAGWTITALNFASVYTINVAAELLGQASALGTRGLLVYTTDAASNAATWLPNGTGFGDVPSRQTIGNEFASAADTFLAAISEATWT